MNIKVLTALVFGAIVGVFTLKTAYAQTATPTPTMTPSPTPMSSTMPSGAPSTGYGPMGY